MSVWYAIPSARPDGGTLPKWEAAGYKVACWRDFGADLLDCANISVQDYYPGYAVAVNELCAAILRGNPDVEWIVTGGDDIEPDPSHDPEQIARECTRHFGGTFGVMQPTGDRFASGSIDRIAGSPWMGRDWCLRANQGKGPLWPQFTHMFEDECLKCTAEMLGVYWMRRDLVHFHRHFMRRDDSLESPAVGKPIPKHLVRWNSREHWDQSERIFKALKATNFAACMPLEAA